jgi:ribosomal protein S14
MYTKYILDAKKRANFKDFLNIKKIIRISLKQKKIHPLNFKLFKGSRKTQIIQRCVLTNRGRGTMRNFCLSRIKLKQFLTVGLIPGYTRSV